MYVYDEIEKVVNGQNGLGSTWKEWKSNCSRKWIEVIEGIPLIQILR